MMAFEYRVGGVPVAAFVDELKSYEPAIKAGRVAPGRYDLGGGVRYYVRPASEAGADPAGWVCVDAIPDSAG